MSEVTVYRIVGLGLLILLIGSLVWPRPKISSDGYRVCAVCPSGFKNNVVWVILSGETKDEQWSEYINDAGKGFCSIDWRTALSKAQESEERK